MTFFVTRFLLVAAVADYKIFLSSFSPDENSPGDIFLHSRNLGPGRIERNGQKKISNSNDLKHYYHDICHALSLLRRL